MSSPIYIGDLVDGKKHGHGKHITKKYIYEGNFENDKMHGKGTYTNLETYDVYEGEFFHNEFQGHGVMKYNSHAAYQEYSGSWSKGKFNGFGKLLFTNTDLYEGWFKLDKKCGKGIFKFHYGASFEGIYYDNDRHGYCKIIECNGDIFEGTYYMGKKEGECSITYKNGDIFTGVWKNGYKQGIGTFCKKENGKKYLQNFDRGVLYDMKLINGDDYPVVQSCLLPQQTNNVNDTKKRDSLLAPKRRR